MHVNLFRILMGLCLLGSIHTLPAQPAIGKKKMMADDKPVLSRLEPRGIQRGVEMKLKLVGNNLEKLTELKLHHPKLKGELIKEAVNGEAWIQLKADPNLARGSYEISVVSGKNESARIKVHVDDLPQVS